MYNDIILKFRVHIFCIRGGDSQSPRTDNARLPLLVYHLLILTSYFLSFYTKYHCTLDAHTQRELMCVCVSLDKVKCSVSSSLSLYNNIVTV